MKKIIFSISLLIIASAAFSQDQLIARRLLIDNAGAQTLHTLTKDVPYTLTHSKDGNGSFTLNENGSPIENGNYPEAATITPIEVKLKNTWLKNDLNNWTEVNKKSDGTSTTAIFQPANTDMPATAPSGAKYIIVRDLYNAVIEGWVSQEITYLPEGTYNFSVSIKGWADSWQGTVNSEAKLYMEKNGEKTYADSPISFLSSGDWTVATASFTTTGGTVKFGIYVDKKTTAQAAANNGYRSWKFSNFSLTAQ